MFENEPRPPSKSDHTRARIRDAAIASFAANGYADTTMRAIADAAGVSASNAYYYFPSKTHLVQELYVRVQHEHAVRARPRLAETTGLVNRLQVVFETGLEAVAPYHRVAPGFLTAMVPPQSPINPLSAESTTAREMTVTLFREAVDEAQHRVPADVATLLPDALFAIYLALVLRWSYERSAQGLQTRKLLDTGLKMFALALPFVRVPGIHQAAREMLALIAEVRS